MTNDGLKAFVNSMGVLCEMWTLTYQNFLKQGMNAKDAMIHTQGFMTALVAASMQNGGGENNV